MPDSSVLTTETVPPHTMPAHGKKASSQMKTTALAKSSSAVFLSTMLGRVLNFATQVLLSNALGLAAFGAFTLGQSLLSFLTAFSQAGLHQATARFLAMGRAQQRPQMVRGVMWFAVPRVVLISVVLGLGLVVLRVPLATLVFHKPEIAPVLFWVGMALPFLSGLNWLGFALRGFRAATMEALLKEVLQPAIFLLLGCGLLLFGGASLEGMWWAFLCGTVASAACGCYHVYRHMHSTPRVKPDRAVGSAMRRFAIPIWFNRLLVALLNQGDRLMLGAFSQVAQVGMYHAAYRIAAFQSMAMTSFVPMFSTAIAEAHACDDRAAIIQHYRTAVRWSVLTTLPVCLVCMTFASEILHIFGKEFESAVTVLWLVSVASFVDGAVGPAGQFLQMIGRERAGLMLVGVATVLAVSLNLVLIPRWGAEGAALGTGAGVVVLNLGRLFTLRRFLGVFPYTWLTARLLGIGLLAAALAQLAAPFGVLAKGAVLVGVFTGGTMLGGLAHEDRLLLGKLKKKLF